MSSLVEKITDKATAKGAPTPEGQHLAAIIPSKRSPFEITHRPTPKPGPDELVIQVKALALNPIDYYQRHYGFPTINYPAIIGSDIAGTVIAAGSSVASDAPKPGARVAAFAQSFFVLGDPDYGAFQTHVLVPAANAVPLPQGMSFHEGSILPMAVKTVFAGWHTIGLPLDAVHTAADKQGILVWGGASSVGTAAVQIAHLMGFRVYATASEKHHEYLKTLGASQVFDYKDDGVVERIVQAAKADGVTIAVGYLAAGPLQSGILHILDQTRGEGTAKLASAPPLAENPPTLDGVEVKFVVSPAEKAERREFDHFVFAVWLKDKLEKGEFVPSPKIRVVGKGLESLENALAEWNKGVSGEKIVLDM
ncbi:MAG: hypothetical protein M1819_004209 [Sarea resinae]|nr:MAG: hypothetical protein M1819_004209 [Sarea resinae]